MAWYNGSIMIWFVPDKGMDVRIEDSSWWRENERVGGMEGCIEGTIGPPKGKQGVITYLLCEYGRGRTRRDVELGCVSVHSQVTPWMLWDTTINLEA